jgi:2-iminobutanoate/2-iminopropanoate deaminase
VADMKAILTPGAPEPRGHYAQAMIHGGFAFLAGQLPVVPGNPGRKLETIEEQTRQVLENIDAVLKACGSSRERFSGPRSSLPTSACGAG